MKEVYFDLMMSIERLHRSFLEVIKTELDQIKVFDLTNIQCFILYNIGDNKMTVGEVSHRGYYLGSNITYNLKKMVENGYIDQEKSFHDKRSSLIKLSDKGLKLLYSVDHLFEIHTKNLETHGLSDQDLKDLKLTLHKLEAFWNLMP